jgi:hypothetical protein
VPGASLHLDGAITSLCFEPGMRECVAATSQCTIWYARLAPCSSGPTNGYDDHTASTTGTTKGFDKRSFDAVGCGSEVWRVPLVAGHVAPISHLVVPRPPLAAPPPPPPPQTLAGLKPSSPSREPRPPQSPTARARGAFAASVTPGAVRLWRLGPDEHVSSAAIHVCFNAAVPALKKHLLR